MQERSITMDHVAQVVNYPAKKFTQGKGISKFIRELNGRKHHVVAQWKSAEKKWLVISVWVRGENDKEPISVQLIMAPFRLIWWLVKKLLK